jgi:UDP-N-acetylglucosamine 3-dehydrogenase
MRFGMLGFAHGHAFGYAQRLNDLADAELVAISDHDALRLQTAIDRYGGAGYADAAELLARADIEAVIVMAETAMHRDLVIAAAEAGKHVLCEKPIATTRADGMAMVEACRQRGVTFGTVFPMRFHPAVIALRQSIRAGEVGAVLSVNATNHGQMPPGWFQDPELAGGGAVMDHVVHVADLLRWMFDAEIVEVYAEIDTRLTPGIPVDDVGILMVRLSNGLTASLDSSWSRAKTWPTWGGVTLDVVGTGGVLAVDAFAERLRLVEDQTPRHVFLPWGEDPDQALLLSFIAAARDRRPAQVTGVDGLRALEVARCAYESARLNMPVACPDCLV